MKRDNKEFYKTRLRNSKFATRISTRLWSEIPSSDNPYLAEQCRCHGYDLFELIEKRSFVDVLYLLFIGELPSKEQARLLETLMIGLINPGPRHPATRAAINAGIGKTDTAHILPISLLTIGGKYLGGNEVSNSMRFLNKNYHKDPENVIGTLLKNTERPAEGDWHIAPGFGTRFGGIDNIHKTLAKRLTATYGKVPVLEWGTRFSALLEARLGCGWLATGIAAAVFSDLGIHPRAGAGLFQFISAPGLLTHGLEMSNKPITDVPFITDDHYVIEE